MNKMRLFSPTSLNSLSPFSGSEYAVLAFMGRGLEVQADWEQGYLVSIDLTLRPLSKVPTRQAPTSLTERFQAYLSGHAHDIPLPFSTEGTAVQEQVWLAVRRIPYGLTRTYGHIAREVGSGSSRAVGQALKANPLPLIIPCHRVVGEKGRLTGFSCGLELKGLLLEFETQGEVT